MTANKEYEIVVGGNLKQTEWPNRQSLTWDQIVKLLSDHQEGPKNGSCYVPGVFNGKGRKSESVYRVDLAVLDSDAGHDLDEIIERIEPHGWMAIIASTHSHQKTSTTAIKSLVEKAGSPEMYLAVKLKYLPELCTGATLEMLPEKTERGHDCVIRHQPIPRYRITLPLKRPWLRSDYESYEEAREAWRTQYEALVGTLGLKMDASGADLHRLFFLPRHDPGAPFETKILDGDPVDIFEIKPTRPGPEHRRTKADKVDTVHNRREPTNQRSGEDVSVIAEFNRRHSIESILVKHDYTKHGHKWLSPLSSTGEPGISIKDGRLSCHHASDPLKTPPGTGARDAFDVWAILSCGADYDMGKAVREAARLMGVSGEVKML